MRKLLTFGLASLLAAISFSASAQWAYTTRSVNVRAGPDTSYPAVAVLAPGAPVQVMGCLNDWSWCDVVFGDNRGWSYAPYLNYDYQGARVPFYSYAPAFGIPIVTFSVGSYWDHYYRGRSFYGRRDYWDHYSYVHTRPAGPAPRASIPSSFRDQHIDNHGTDRHSTTVINNHVDVHNSREVNVTRENRNTQVVNAAKPVNTGKPTPTTGHPQEMHKVTPAASPVAPAGPVSRGTPQGHPQGNPQGNPGQGNPHANAGHTNEHGAKDEKHQ